MSELQMLPAWLDAGAAALAGAVPPAPTLAGALPGLAQAQSLTPAQRLQRVQESGLAECGGAGEPIYLAWRQFLRGRGPSVLVIDATDFDARARGSAAVLDERHLAAGRGRADRCRPARQPQGRAAPAGRADRPRSGLPEYGRRHPMRSPRSSVPRIQVEVQRNSRPSCWGEGQASRRVTAGPHAGDLVPDRPAVRRRCRTSMRRC